MGFTKLDEGIVFSSIMGEDDSVFKVFSIFLATCKSNGISPVSPVFISSITKKPLEEVMRCILVLESPDPLSRSTTEEGRRIKKVDGGYYLVNYHKYRDFTYSDNPEAVRKRIQRSNKDILGHVPCCPDISGHSASASYSVSSSNSHKEGESGGKEKYFTEELESYQKLISNKDWLTEQEKYHPNLNILLSLEKAHTQFWGTEVGWEHTKKKKSKKKNWKRTYENALSQRVNQVWKSKEEIKNIPFEERASL